MPISRLAASKTDQMYPNVLLKNIYFIWGLFICTRCSTPSKIFNTVFLENLGFKGRLSFIGRLLDIEGIAVKGLFLHRFSSSNAEKVRTHA